jgi:peptidoglycan/xylan/chitin deacetylase (PgdA/CDA1 family)
MSPGTFETRLAELQRLGYEVVSLADGLLRLREGTLSDAAVAITFDDGTHDFFLKAHPILASYGVPATVYVTTYYSDFQRPVFPIFCSYLLWKGRANALSLESIVPGAGRVVLDSREARRHAVEVLRRYAREAGLDALAKDDLARRLADGLRLDYQELAERGVLHIMTNDELRQLGKLGVDVQLHTHRHRTPLEKSLFLREIADNRVRLEALTGRHVSHFCYPSGVHRKEFLPWLAEAGIESAVTCHPALAQQGSPALLLPRYVDTEAKTLLEFDGCVSGAVSFLPRRPSPGR